MSSLGSPDIAPLDFPLPRKLAAAGNCWVVRVRMALAANRGTVLILPSATQGLIVPRVFIAVTANIEPVNVGTATAIATPVASTPMNMIVNSVAVATFSANQSAAGGPTGANAYYSNAILANTGWDLPLPAPFVLPAGSATGVLVDTAGAFTGNIDISIEVQEFPY